MAIIAETEDFSLFVLFLPCSFFFHSVFLNLTVKVFLMNYLQGSNPYKRVWQVIVPEIVLKPVGLVWM